MSASVCCVYACVLADFFLCSCLYVSFFHGACLHLYYNVCVWEKKGFILDVCECALGSRSAEDK